MHIWIDYLWNILRRLLNAFVNASTGWKIFWILMLPFLYMAYKAVLGSCSDEVSMHYGASSLIACIIVNW